MARPTSSSVGVGGVDQVDAGIQDGVDDRGDVVLSGAADGTEVHRAERESADLDAGAAERAVLHGNSSKGRYHETECCSAS
jgi:hypothetical protein